MKEHPDIVRFCRFPAYVRTHSTGILRGLPLSTRTLEQSLVCYIVRGVQAPGTHVRSDYPQTRHIGGRSSSHKANLDSAKQKAGYHRHGDTLPLLVYRFCVVFRKTSGKQKSTRTLSRKESGSSTNCMVDGTGLEPVTSCTSSRCSTS